MLVCAAEWRPDSTPRSLDEVLADPALAHYVANWPQPGDFGVIAEDCEGRQLGAAWCRSVSSDHPGYGFVSPEVPELSIGVIKEARGRGTGRRLIEELIEAARKRGFHRLSLSVESDNFAMRLYADVGFSVVAEADGAATMLLELG